MTNHDLLPLDWIAVEHADGITELRIANQGTRAAWVFGAVAAMWTYALLVDARQGTSPLNANPLLAGFIELLLSGLTLWCAFGREFFLIQSDGLEWRVGFGTWFFRRRVRGARLEIVGRVKRYRRYYRFYAVTDQRRYFLVERSISELQMIAHFIGERTGWNVTVIEA